MPKSTKMSGWKLGEGGKEQAELTPSWKRRKLHPTFPVNFGLCAGSQGDHIPMAEEASWTDRHQIPYQDFPSPERM